MKITAVFFGTFDPPHFGHLGLARWVLANTEASEVLFVVSGQNPFKNAAKISPWERRLAWVREMVSRETGMAVSDVEGTLPRPSYTEATLAALAADGSDRRLVVLLGADQAKDFSKWKNWLDLLNRHEFWVYPRPGHRAEDGPIHPSWKALPAPVFSISSTEIRERWQRGEDASDETPIRSEEFLKK